MSDNIDVNAELANYGMHLEFWPVADLLKLSKATRNPKKHFNEDIAALASAFESVGFKGAVYINKDATEIPAGNGRILAAARTKKYEKLPVFRILDLDKAKLKKFALGDNKIKSDKYDEQILVEILKSIVDAGEDIKYLDYGKYDKLLVDDMAAAQPEPLLFEIPDDMDSYRAPGGLVGGALSIETSQMTPGVSTEKIVVDDLLFPTDNEWDVPVLSKKFMADGAEMPFVKWGEISRRTRMGGTWHFYVNDRKFDNLWRDPTGPLMSGAAVCAEINFSTSETFPRSLALGDIYKKRWIARYWQSRGMKIIVDVNIDSHLYDIALLGVPRGWKTFSTRGQTSEIDTLDTEFALAAECAGTDDITFIVYGGGHAIKAKCVERAWVYIPERMDEVIGSSEILSGLPVKVKRSDLS